MSCKHFLPLESINSSDNRQTFNARTIITV